MANSHLPVDIPDVDYDADDDNESTEPVLEDNVFDNPIYDCEHDNHTADASDVIHTSNTDDTDIIDHQAEVAVCDVQFTDEEEASKESFSSVDDQGIETVKEVVTANGGIDVERQGFSSLEKEDIAAEARRVRERDLTICVSMFIVVVIALIVSLVIFFAVSSTKSSSPTTESPMTSDQPSDCSGIISRAEWGARTAIETEPLPIPTPYLVIHHTDTSECSTHEDCVQAVRGIQNFHMDTNGWWDIGYNFLIGGDGHVYEGRGWDIKGAHAREYNQYSVGVSLIGNYENNLPSSVMLDTLDRFTDCLLGRAKLDPCYTLYGHRQAVASKCPGESFYTFLQDDPHWRFTNDSIGNPNPLTPCDR